MVILYFYIFFFWNTFLIATFSSVSFTTKPAPDPKPNPALTLASSVSIVYKILVLSKIIFKTFLPQSIVDNTLHLTIKCLTVIFRCIPWWTPITLTNECISIPNPATIPAPAPNPVSAQNPAPAPLIVEEIISFLSFIKLKWVT